MEAVTETSEEGIDDIFADLKKNVTKATTIVSRPEKKKKKKGEKRSEKVKDWDRAGERREGEEPSVHRYTEEGLPVYKYYHLGMNQEDGGTPLCPFDCKCCF